MIKQVNLFTSDNKDHLSNFPVYFFESYNQFINKIYNHQVICLHHTELNAFTVFRIRKAKIWKFAQLLHSPLKPGSKLSKSEETLFFSEITPYLKNNLNVDKIEQGDILGFTKYVPQHAKYSKFGTYVFDLKKYTPENLINAIHNRTARYIKNADKQNLELKSGLDNLEDFYHVYKMTSEHTSMYTDQFNYFTTAAEILGDTFCNALVAYDNSNPIGALFMLHTPYKLCITHTGTNRSSDIHGAIRWIHYKNMLLAMEKGIKYYDFMGVRINSTNKKLKGVFEFKKRFGGELEEGYLWKQTLNKLHLLPYTLINSTRIALRGNKFKDIIDQET